VGSSCALGIDPGEIEAVVLSHIHGDHIGGLSGLLPMAVEIVRKAKALSGIKSTLSSAASTWEGRAKGRSRGSSANSVGWGARFAPCHCTGEQARRMFRQEYGEDFIQAGAGKVIRILPSACTATVVSGVTIDFIWVWLK